MTIKWGPTASSTSSWLYCGRVRPTNELHACPQYRQKLGGVRRTRIFVLRFMSLSVDKILGFALLSVSVVYGRAWLAHMQLDHCATASSHGRSHKNNDCLENSQSRSSNAVTDKISKILLLGTWNHDCETISLIQKQWSSRWRTTESKLAVKLLLQASNGGGLVLVSLHARPCLSSLFACFCFT